MPQPPWMPKYPDFAVRPEGGLHEEDLGTTTVVQGDDSVVREIEWISKPESENVHSIAFESHIPRTRYFSRDAARLNQSILHVRFKPERDRTGRIRHYLYYFPDDATGSDIFEQMKAAAHPWSEVGYPRLVLAKVLYDRLM